MSPTSGSSPRMRGSPTHSSFSQSHTGIIPAHAGLTVRIVCSIRFTRDHPRACGAHARTLSVIPDAKGSSPRMRGSHSDIAYNDVKTGIIPAHAGLTASSGLNKVKSGDHPRACGAHATSWLWRARFRGSSPRMRGSLIVNVVAFSGIGIIPAHAGLTAAG